MINFVINRSNMTENTRGSTENETARKNLFDYAIKGKWNEAMQVYMQYAWLRPEKITINGETALHIAVQDRKEMFVKEMVELVSTPDQYEGVLKSQNEQGNTPLHLAATIGNVSMCKYFVRKCKDLLSIRNKEGETPVFLAARHGKIEAFFCLVREALNSDLAYNRNKKGETILHSAVAGGNFKMASLIIERYEDLGSKFDEKGVSPLHLLASHPTAFRSGTRLSLIDEIIYHCIFVPRPDSGHGDVGKSKDVAERLANNIKKLFSLLVTFMKICINPSVGAKADLDEEMPAQAISKQGQASTSDQGPHELNIESEKKGGLSQRNFPVNYDTCFNFIMLLINAILGILFLGIGRSYVNKIQQKKENHISAAKILEKLLDKAKGHWYDSTGQNPLYKDRTITYKVEVQESDLSRERPEMHPECEDRGGRSETHPGPDSSLKTPDKQLECEKVSKDGTSTENGFHNFMRSQLEEVKKSTDLMHKQLEEAQRSAECIHKLIEQAHTNELRSMNDKSQEWYKRLNQDSNWALMQTMCKAINQTAKKLCDDLPSKTVTKNQEGKLGAPILIAAQNGIAEMVGSILACFPEAIHDANPEKKNIVLLAVENRHPHVYKVLLNRVNNLTDTVFGAVDDNGNSALHLAAMFTDPRPWLTPGAALQMQWEVKWFEYVKNNMPSSFILSPNKNGESPQQIFTDKHKDLVQKGGEWLNNTATSCSVVSTLIATVAFATSATLPGGNKEKNGMPVLGPRPAFHLFTISSLIALCFSITATIMFLAILTSRHREKDFAKDLPIKLLAGLTSLFVSILAILVSFCSAHFFSLQRELRSYALPIYAVTCLPATLFAIAQLPLYLDLTWTTFSTVPQPPLEDNT